MDGLDNLLTFWFPNSEFQEFWFDGSKDYEIQEKFGKLLQTYESLVDSTEYFKGMYPLGLIILFDQITRNIARLDGSNPKRNDHIALKLAGIELYNNIQNSHLNYDLQYPLNKRIFLLLPLRHSRTTDNLDFVIKKLNSYQQSEKDTKLFQKFYLATLKDYAKVTDTIKIIDDTIENHPQYDNFLHDDMCKSYIGLRIIHKDSLALVHPLAKSIQKFVSQNKIRRIAVSLSGGVDSNVLLYILYQIKLHNKLDILIAIHVDYSNRYVSEAEATYLSNVCRYLSIPMVTRKIVHMKRDDDRISRQFYEEETKKIRFGLYKHALALYNIQGVCLGHHKDDLIENVFMNLLRGKDLLDLFVMTSSALLDGVTILRPMLEHQKEAIYQLAHAYNIMYFKDTTPDWCLRGCVRKKIFPEIIKFDPNMIFSLNSAGTKSDEWRTVVDNMAIQPILKSLIVGKAGFSIEFQSNFNGLPVVMWSRLFVKLFHGQQIRMISGKNLTAFVNWTNSKSRDSVLCMLTNGLIACNEENRIYFWFASKLIKNDESVVVTYNLNSVKTIQFGSWSIEIEQTTDHIKNNMTLNDLLSGSFEYTIPIDINKPTFEIAHKISDKNRVKKLFRRLHKLGQYLPKCSSNAVIDGSTLYVKVTIKLQ